MPLSAPYLYENSVETVMSADVLVIGGGSAGSAAAVAAAEHGARTILVERYGFLGGTGAMVLDTFYGFFTPGTAERKVVGGIPDRIVAGLAAFGAILKRPNTYGAGSGWTYDPERLKVVWDDLVAAAGIHTLLHSYFVDVIESGGRIVGALVATKRGLVAIEARCVIDASGDAEVVARAGGAFEDSHAMGVAQSLTTTFKMINVDVHRATATPKAELWRLMEEASMDGYELPRREGSAHISPLQHVMVTNMTRVAGVDATDPTALAGAERAGRKQAFEYARFLVDRVPGYEHAALGGLSIQIGVRESRRIRGEYWLSREDVVNARKFEDAIALCGAPIEDHHAGGDTRWEYLPDGETYGIPFGCLVPSDLDGVLVAGRCLSASHDAHASVRSIGQCLAMGQAAGIAAAMTRDGDIRAVDRRQLRRQLFAYGAVL